MREYNKQIMRKIINVAVTTALNLFMGMLLLLFVGGMVGLIYNLIR